MQHTKKVPSNSMHYITIIFALQGTTFVPQLWPLMCCLTLFDFLTDWIWKLYGEHCGSSMSLPTEDDCFKLSSTHSPCPTSTGSVLQNKRHNSPAKKPQLSVTKIKVHVYRAQSQLIQDPCMSHLRVCQYCMGPTQGHWHCQWQDGKVALN